jgi:hypothetical protein
VPRNLLRKNATKSPGCSFLLGCNRSPNSGSSAHAANFPVSYHMSNTPLGDLTSRTHRCYLIGVGFCTPADRHGWRRRGDLTLGGLMIRINRWIAGGVCPITRLSVGRSVPFSNPRSYSVRKRNCACDSSTVAGLDYSPGSHARLRKRQKRMSRRSIHLPSRRSWPIRSLTSGTNDF